MIDNLREQRFSRRKPPLRTLVGILISLLLVIASPLHAEEAKDSMDEKGAFIGVKLIGSSLHLDDQPGSDFFIKDDGAGMQLHTGYRFNSVFALDVTLGGARHDTSDPRLDAKIGSIQIFALYRFVPGRPFRPYIKGGIGGYTLELEEQSVDVRIEGGGIAFGGGFDYFFSPRFSLGADFTHNLINYEEVSLEAEGFSVGLEIDEEGSMTSLGMALTFYF